MAVITLREPNSTVYIRGERQSLEVFNSLRYTRYSKAPVQLPGQVNFVIRQVTSMTTFSMEKLSAKLHTYKRNLILAPQP